MQGGAVPSPSPAAAPEDEADQTVVITPASNGSPAAPSDPDTGLDATMVPTGAQPAAVDSTWQDGDQEATVVINAGTPAPPGIGAPPSDDDLEATLIQGAAEGAPPAAPTHGATGGPPAADLAGDPDLEATIVIKPNTQTAVIPSSPDDDEDLAATLIETPRRSDQPSGQMPPAQPGPPPPPQETPGANGPAAPAPKSNNRGADDDDIMEQTIIIRSEMKKE